MIDRYAKIENGEIVLKNITGLIRCPENNRIISLYYSDEKYMNQQASDFEYFAELCRVLPDIVGTMAGEHLMEILFLLCDWSGDFKALSKEEILCELWKNGNRFLQKIEGNYEDLLRIVGADYCNTTRLLKPSSDRVEKYQEKEGEEHLRVDLRGLPFTRPDPYHARLAEEKLQRGEALQPSEESCLCLERLYLFCTEATGTPTVHLRVDGDGLTGSSAIEYVRRRGLACQFLVAADDMLSAETVTALCGLAGDGVTVRPEIVIGDTDSRCNLYARLCRLSALYPMSQWRFGGRPTQSLLFFTAHRVYERVMADLRRDVAYQK